VTVEEAVEAAGVMGQQEHLVFAVDEGVDAAGAGVDLFDVAEQEAGGVEVVDEGFIEQEAGVGTEVGLGGVGIGAVAIELADAEGVGDGRAEEALGEFGVHDAVPGLPAPVFVDDQGDTGGFGEFDHGEGVGPGGGERLLAEDGDAAFDGSADHFEVEFRAGGDVEEVGLEFVEHLVEMLVGGPGGVGVAGADDGDVFDAPPGFEMDLTEETATD